MEAKISRAEDYKKKFGQRFKIATTPMGETFKIQKLVVADFMQEYLIPLGYIDPADLENWEDKSKEERAAIIGNNTTPERDKSFMQTILVKGVVEPKVTRDEIAPENEISVHDLNDVDTAFLFNEILKISGLSKEGREDISPFPAGERGDARSDGQDLREDAARTPDPGVG